MSTKKLFVVTVATPKGGGAKSTTSTNLAVEASRAGFTPLIVDADKLRTSKDWYDQRPEEHDKPELIEIPEKDIIQAHTHALKNDYDLMIIDTAGRDLPSINLCLPISDLVIITAGPTSPDLKAIPKLAETLLKHKTDFLFLITKAPTSHNTKSRIKIATDLLLGFGPVSPVSIGYRLAFQDAMALGLGVSELDKNSKAAKESQAFWNVIQSKIINLLLQRQKTKGGGTYADF